ncbi:Ribosome production factor 1 [Cladochytrium tenue]|nr:Ribosome production factor 1 [Cladochytrium tenue]
MLDATYADLKAAAEALRDEDEDDFAKYFKLVMSLRFASLHTIDFAAEFCSIIPDAEFVRHQPQFCVKRIVELATKRGYTNLVVIKEDKKEPVAITFIHLPAGPTAHFKLSSIKLNKEIRGHGKVRPQKPELILNNFNTRLGHTPSKSSSAAADPATTATTPPPDPAAFLYADTVADDELPPQFSSSALIDAAATAAAAIAPRLRTPDVLLPPLPLSLPTLAAAPPASRTARQRRPTQTAAFRLQCSLCGAAAGGTGCDDVWTDQEFPYECFVPVVVSWSLPMSSSGGATTTAGPEFAAIAANALV